MKEDKKIHFKEVFVAICILIIVIIFGINLYIKSKESEENEKQWQEYASLISKKQNEIENIKEEIQNNEVIKKGSYDKPYVPNGFNYVEGSWNDGYVIQDENGNEFVWVPCKTYINDDVVELKRYNFDISYNLLLKDCYENIENVKEFIESVGNYEGFYIARYEAGKEDHSVVSKKDVEVYTNVSYAEAVEFSKKMYQKEGINSSLINSLAWDTTLKWIDKTTNSKYSTKGSYTSSYSNILQKTGYDSINKVYDLSGNAWEWTTEKSYEYSVYRGGYNASVKDSKRAPGYRDMISGDSKYNNIGFRVIIYAK